MYFSEILFVVETEQTQLVTEQMLIATKCNHPFETQKHGMTDTEKHLYGLSFYPQFSINFYVDHNHQLVFIKFSW